VASATPYQPLGVIGATPLAKNGVVRPPPKAKTHFSFFFFFFFWAFWGGRTTPKGLEWLRPPPYSRYGVAEATPWPKMGWSGHPTFGKGVAPASSHPNFLFFFFFFFFQFPSFFQKKKKKPKMQNYAILPKTASF
jgi:hypothetical protein